MKEDRKLYDFYYSEKMSRIPDLSMTYFKGTRYTAMCQQGQDHGCKWDDMQFLGTGTNLDITHLHKGKLLTINGKPVEFPPVTKAP